MEYVVIEKVMGMLFVFFNKIEVLLGEVSSMFMVFLIVVCFVCICLILVFDIVYCCIKNLIYGFLVFFVKILWDVIDIMSWNRLRYINNLLVKRYNRIVIVCFFMKMEIDK